jgi:hypothetical protein
VIPTDVLERMLLDVVAGRPGPPNESAERREVRAKLTREVQEIRDKGGQVDVPAEIP